MWILYIVYSLLILTSKANSVKVKIAEGELNGEKIEFVTKDGYYYSFKGIPYAASPVGELRFKAPQSPLPWQGVKNATSHGDICIQYDIFSNKIVYGSEDCLFLNVYTPNLNPESPLAVMVYIHGGGYESDSGNDANYGPDFIVQNGVVLVTFNYRLKVLGFLSLDTKDVPGNAGMKDQVEALKWVRRNIRSFGGDPDNVTIFGQSAGGVSTILHMLSPMSKGLFKRAISMSGVPSCDWAMGYYPRRRALVLGKQLRLHTNDLKELYQFLLTVPADKLVNVKPNIFTSEEITGNILKMFHFAPVVEKDFGQERFLTEEPEKILKERNFNNVDLIIGHVSEEGIGDLVFFEESFMKTYSQYADMLVPREILLKKSTNEILDISDMIQRHYFGTKAISKNTLKEFLNYINDSTYNYHIHRYIKMLSKVLSNNIFVYKFSGVSDRNIYGKIGIKYNLTGASHLDDTAYLFDPKHANLALDKSSKEYQIVQHTTKMFTNFAKHGNPTPDSSLNITWPPYNNETEMFMDIGEYLKLGRSLDSDAAEFWKMVYSKAGLEF